MADIRTLADVKEEVQPEGRKTDKEDLVGVPIVIMRCNFFTGDWGPAVYVVAAVHETGEYVNFTGGTNIREQLEPFVDYLPLATRIVKIPTKRGQDAFLLDDGRVG